MDIEPGDAVHAYGLGIAFVESIGKNYCVTLAHGGERKCMHITGLRLVKPPSARLLGRGEASADRY